METSFPSSLEIKHLRMIAMIARTRNLTRAAGNLFLSQPALSQQLRDIETRLGTPLFHRTSRQMILTRIGKKLLNHARIILEELDKAELAVKKAVNGETGELKIGVRCLFCYKWLPTVIRSFQEKYPNVELAIGNSIEPEKDLLSKTWDMAIATAPVQDPGIAFTGLFEDEFLCVMAGDHPFSRRKFLDITDFEGMNMISMVEKKGPSFYRFFFQSKGVRAGRYMTVTHPEAVVELVEAGLGISILPQWFIRPYLAKKNIRTCHLTARKTVLQWKASYLKDADMPEFHREFIRMIKASSAPAGH